MPIDRRYFTETNDLNKGDRVAFRHRTLKPKPDDIVDDQGVITLIWLGIEEMVDVLTDDGRKYGLCRAIGDEIVLVSTIRHELEEGKKDITMRDPQRIDRIINRLRSTWHENPDQRLGQLVSNVAGGDDKVYYIEDEDLELNL